MKHGESDQNHNFGGPNVKQNIGMNTGKQDFKDIQGKHPKKTKD